MIRKVSLGDLQSVVHQQKSLVHWYKGHQTINGNNGVIHTEESENEYILEEKRYVNTLCSFLCNPYVRCYYKVKRIRAYRHYVHNIFEETFRSLRWIDLPGGQHQVAVDRNYLMNYVWLMSFITNEIDTTNKDSARHIRYRFEDVLFQAESLGIILQQFIQPLQAIAQSQSLIEEIGDLAQVKIPRLPVERKIFTLPRKPDYTILPSNNIRDFGKLLTYVRRDSQVWSKFRSLTESDKVDIVSKGLMEISDNLKELKGLLKRPLRALQAAYCKFILVTLLRPTLIPHVTHLRDAVKRILEQKHDKEDNTIIEMLLSEVADHYAYVMRYGELIVEEVWDIILMVRLSYNFIKESPQNNIMVASHEAVMSSKFRPKKLKKLLKPSNFTVDDFFLVECPDTLRKLPIVIMSRSTELCLHLQGHTNSHKSRTLTPMKRFTMRRGDNASSDKGDSEKDTGSQKPGTLLFVSEGD